jgi:hypothetical protein
MVPPIKQTPIYSIKQPIKDYQQITDYQRILINREKRKNEMKKVHNIYYPY